MIQLIAKLNSEIKKDLPEGRSQKWWGLTPGRVYKAEPDDFITNPDGGFVHLLTDNGSRIVNVKRFIIKTDEAK